MKKIFTLVLLTVTLFSFSSCKTWLDVNQNVDAPDRVDAYLYLAGILSNYQGVYWDIRATGELTQMLHGYSSNYGNHFYTANSDAAGETWRYVYWLHGKNLENLIDQSVAAENWTLAGIGYTIKAMDWDNLTKLNGEAPMKQAYEPGRLAHEYDYQDDIYAQVIEWAETAIEYLEMEDNTEYGSTLVNSDLAFKGNKEKWLKVAHGVIVSNLASLTCKADFKEKYYQTLCQHAALALQTNDDNFTVRVDGGGVESQGSGYNQWWGVYRGNLDGYRQGDYAVQVMTGTIPVRSESGTKVKRTDIPEGMEDDPYYKYYPYEYIDPIVCDTVREAGHFDPRVTLKIASLDSRYYTDMNKADSVMKWRYYGGTTSSSTQQNSAEGTIANIWGTRSCDYASAGAYDYEGRWLYRNDAPYILMTAAEIKFMLAEAQFVAGDKAAALETWKEAVKLDVDMNALYMNEGKEKVLSEDKETGVKTYAIGGEKGGDHITKSLYNSLAAAYKAGPFVDGMTLDKFTLSHIMMQKYVALFPWGASEVWVDLRKYHYDIPNNAGYPSMGDGWDNITSMNYKKDTDPTKVFKGFYLLPMTVEGKNGRFDYRNEGSPCYRLRPRYNSEYMWNMASLKALTPIPGDQDNYQCSIPWFAYPNGYPETVKKNNN